MNIGDTTVVSHKLFHFSTLPLLIAASTVNPQMNTGDTELFALLFTLSWRVPSSGLHGIFLGSDTYRSGEDCSQSRMAQV